MAHRRQGALGPGKPFSTVFILLDDHQVVAYAASRGCTSRLICSADARVATSRS